MKIQKLITLLIFMLVSCMRINQPMSMSTSTRFLTPTRAPKPSITIVATPSPLIYLPIYGVLLSPDGTKRIQSSDWNNYQILTADGIVVWSISYENKLGALEPGWKPFYWSLDGRYIYFSCYHGPDDGSTKFFGNDFTDGDCIYRFDVNTGKIIELIPEIFPGYYAFTISSDGSKLVYTNQTETPVKIKLLDLHTDKEQILFTADDKILEIGSYGWSPKMDKIIFTTLEMVDSDKRIYSFFMLDLKSLGRQMLVENFEEHLALDKWGENGKIYYHDPNRRIWQLELESKILTPLAVPTLTLAP